MRTKVIEFLKAPEGMPEETFNQAVLLYMKAPNSNASLLRAYNTQGYSEQRLKELIYDLKQAFNITDLEVVSKQKAKVVTLKPKAPSGETLPEGYPKFKDGREGNAERKAYVKELGIVSESNKTVDLDKAIIAFLREKQAEKAAEQYANEKAAIALEIATKQINAEAPNEAELKAIQEKLALTDEEFDDFMMIDVVKAIEVSGETEIGKVSPEFEKVVELIKAGEIPPASLIREIYGDAEMSDENAQGILEEATALVNDSDPEEKSTDVSGNDTGVAKKGTDVSENETKAPNSETKNVTETSKSPDTEKK